MIKKLFNKIKDFILTGTSDLTKTEEQELLAKYEKAVENGGNLNAEEEKALEDEMKSLLVKLVPSFDKIACDLKEMDSREDDIFEYLAVIVTDMQKVTESKNKQEFLKNKKFCKQVIKTFVRKFNSMTFKNK